MNMSPSQEEPSIAWTSTTAFAGLEEPPVAAGDRLVVIASGTVFVLDAYSGIRSARAMAFWTSSSHTQ